MATPTGEGSIRGCPDTANHLRLLDVVRSLMSPSVNMKATSTGHDDACRVGRGHGGQGTLNFSCGEQERRQPCEIQ